MTTTSSDLLRLQWRRVKPAANNTGFDGYEAVGVPVRVAAPAGQRGTPDHGWIAQVATQAGSQDFDDGWTWHGVVLSNGVHLELPNARDALASVEANLPELLKFADPEWSDLPAITRAWSADTSSDPDGWTQHNRAYGQCAVTALLVQKLMGGELLRAMVGDVSHYWNRLPSGVELDLTRGQFETFDPGPVETRTREYALSYPATAARYRILARAVADEMFT